MTVTTWRYYLPNDTQIEGWAICFLDSTGCFSVLSDWGNYGYRWPLQGWGPGDFRAFFIDCHDDYVLRKLAPAREYDAEGTLRQVKDRILEARRCGAKSREWAEREWTLLPYFDHLESNVHFAMWLQETSLDDAHMLSASRYSEQAEQFIKRVMPRLRGAIRAELKAEADNPNPHCVGPGRQLVYCSYCNKTHSILPDEQPCAPGAWLDPRPIGGSS